MKKLIALLLALTCLFGSAMSDSPATPTDLVEFTDDDWGSIDIPFERKVFISMDKKPRYIGDEMSLTAVLVDFQPEDKYIIYWQYSDDKIKWNNLENEHEQTLTIITDNINYHYWWRVLIDMEG